MPHTHPPREQLTSPQWHPEPTTFELGDGTETLQVTVTEEGVIMDAYFDGDMVGTVGMMADEWFDWVAGRAVLPNSTDRLTRG